jgi:hypothetical protein
MYEVVHQEQLLMLVFHLLSKRRKKKRKDLEFNCNFVEPYLILFVLYSLIEIELKIFYNFLQLVEFHWLIYIIFELMIQVFVQVLLFHV